MPAKPRKTTPKRKTKTPSARTSANLKWPDNSAEALVETARTHGLYIDERPALKTNDERAAFIRDIFRYEAQRKEAAPAFLRRNHRRLVAFIADIHAGSTHGLLNPETKIETVDKATNRETVKTFAPSVWSEILWAHTGVEAPARVREMADGDSVDLIAVGDVTQGNKHPDGLYTASVSSQIEMAYQALLPFLNLPTLKTFGVVAGTGSHSFGEGTSEEQVAAKVKDRHKLLDVECAYHFLHTIGGVPFDITHHGANVGGKPWTDGNAVRGYVMGELAADVSAGRESPKVYVSAHVHRPVAELVRYGQRRAWGIVCPANQAPNDYARKAGRSPRDWTFGVVVVEIIDGKVVGEPIELCKTLDIRTRRETTYD